ncbi:MAG TPA: hypothetical protein VFH38_06055 [Jatrophihabitans sp.]|nr:hypothetical protein [Jatrophihabitans sp.]
MTYQPPQPPGGTPPPPPSGQWGPPPGGGQPNRSTFDPKTVNPLDWAILGIGALLFIFSFFGYYSWSYNFGPYSGSYSFSAWHFGGGTFIAWFAMIIGVIAAVVVAAELFAPGVKLPMAGRSLALGLFALSFILYVIAIFAHSDFGPNGGHGFSFWLSLVLAAAGAVLSLMRLQQTGGQLPGALAGIPNIGQHGPQGGISSHHQQHGAAPQQGYAPPPAQGYAPPPQQGYAPPPQQGYATPPPPSGSATPPPPPPGYGPPQ